MPFLLDLRHESLTYKGQYAKPAMELWGNGGAIVKWMLDSLGPHGVTLPQIKLGGNLPSQSEWLVLAEVPGVGPVKFSFDKLEFNFINFSQDFFASLPETMDSLVEGLRRMVPDLKFSSHSFVYFCHSFVKDGTPQDALRAVNPVGLKDAGISLGNGAIFNYTVPSRNWETQLTIDRSRHLTGGLFLSLDVRINSGDIDYEQVIQDSREYLAGILQELNLALPETQS